jgi:flagellar biosynthesis/type III secretory pathway protein FliH
VKEFKAGKTYYSPQFGNRTQFVDGYEDGFRVGYADAYAGKEYRAARTSRALAEALQPNTGNSRPDGNFDQGFSKGYKLGLKTGLEHGRENVEYAPQSDVCDASDSVKKDATNPYCKAFGLGYELGYSDGYNNQRTPDSTLRTAIGDK